MGYFSELDIDRKTVNFALRMRLEAVKKRAAEWAKHNPEGAYKSALDHQVKYKRKGWIKYDTANHYDAAGNLCLENLDQFDAVPIQDVSRRAFDYSGYYADNYQMELIKPYIVRIKTKEGLFIAPAIAYNDSDMATIYFSRGGFCSKDENTQDYYESAYQAARIADSIAEKEAEIGRDDDAKFQAEQEAEQLKDENRRSLNDARALIAAIREQKTIGAIVAPICNALISDIKGIRASIRRNNRRIQELKNNYWLAVS